MSPPLPPDATALIARLHALIAALEEGPCDAATLTARLGAAYPAGDSARRMIDRDVRHLAALGVAIDRAGSPPHYALRGGLPAFDAAELRTLALVRDTFDPRHPQAAQVGALLGRLTAGLGEGQRADYARRAARRAPVQPAIDYAPYADRIAELERAIAVREPVRFRYRASSGSRRLHPRVEPYEIEFVERHFYLVGHSTLSNQIHDFRIDRIDELAGLGQRLPPGSARRRPPLTFRYRLAAALAQGELSQRFEAQRVVERLPGGDLIIEAEGRSDFFIIQTLLRYRANAELLEPAWLRARMAAEVRALAEVYGVTGDA